MSFEEVREGAGGQAHPNDHGHHHSGGQAHASGGHDNFSEHEHPDGSDQSGAGRGSRGREHPDGRDQSGAGRGSGVHEHPGGRDQSGAGRGSGGREHPDGHDHSGVGDHSGGHGSSGGHDHDHSGGHDHPHGHGGAGGWWHRLRHVVTPHSHDTADQVDSVLEASREGMRAVWISLAGLGVTAVLQGFVVAWSGSVALLGDTLHNLADALTAVPLGIAFLVGRRAATKRYTYGYGRAEDLAGIAIVAFIAISAGLAAFEAVRRLVDPADVRHLGAVAVAGLVGFAGNELVARYRIRVGRRIGSAALVADGLHARTDGFTSLGVLFSAGGLALGWRWADPAVGLGIAAAIVVVLAGAARQVYRRLMDAVDPDLVDTVRATLLDTGGVLGLGEVRLRWIGHNLRAECEIVVPGDLSLVRAHDIAVDAEHRLLHAVPRLSAAIVHADPQPHPGADPHAAVAHHRDPAAAGPASDPVAPDPVGVGPAIGAVAPSPRR